VAFLAIPSVDPGNHIRTPTQLASYLSVVTSIGSVVIGLLLLRQHRTKPQDAADEVDNYLRSRHHNALGFETLAILYSLPYALLLWSTVAFTTAFTLETLLFSEELWARIPVAAVLLIVTLLISWCIGTTFEAETDFSALGSVHVLKDHLVKFTRGLRGKATEPGLYEEGARDDDGQGTGGMLKPTGTLKETFSRPWRRRKRASTNATLVGSPGRKGSYGPPDGAGVEMGEMNNNVPV